MFNNCLLCKIYFLYLDLPRDALQQFQKALRVDETHQMALVGVCRTLRKLGQHSRLHQAVLRQVEIIFPFSFNFFYFSRYDK